MNKKFILLVLPLLGGVLVLAGDTEDVLGDLQVNGEVDRLHNLLATASGAVVHKPIMGSNYTYVAKIFLHSNHITKAMFFSRIPFQVKDKDGWKVLKAEVPAGLHLLPGLRADVPVQLLAREVLQEPGNNMGCLFTGTPNVQYRKENGL